MHKNWFTVLNVKVTARAYVIKIPQREAVDAEMKSHLLRKQSLKVLPLKPGVGQYRAIHAVLTARDFFLVYLYPSGPFTCIFSKPLPIFSSVGCG